MKKLLTSLLFSLWTASAWAGVSCSLPITLTNGTLADANQVMSDFNALVTCLTNAAASGANSDITSLSGITTPIPAAEGGSSAYIGSTSTGSANAQIVASPTPNGFTLTNGYRIYFIAGFTNTTAMQLNVNGTGNKAVFRMSPSGPQALTGGEIVAGNMVAAIYDGTQFELITRQTEFGGFGPVTTLASAATTDLGTIPSHNVSVSGTTTITSFGSTAVTTYPFYQITFTGSLTLTNSGALALPNGVNVITQAGDTAFAMYLGAGNWKVFQYIAGAAAANSIFVGAVASTGTNTLAVTSTTPSNFIYSGGLRLLFIAGGTNTGAATLNVNGLGAKNVFRQSPSGPQALSGGEIQANSMVEVTYDNTQFEIISNTSSQYGGYGPLTNLSAAATTDLGTVPSHYVNITSAPATITSFGSTAVTTFPNYRFIINSAATGSILTNSASLVLPGGANITAVTNDTGLATYLGSGNWQVVSYQPASGAAVINQAPICGATNLKITNNAGTPNSIINLSADQVTMLNASNVSIFRSTVNLSAINITNGNVTSTANAMDGEAPGTNNWLNVFLIDNGTAPAGLVSLASANNLSPTMPAGYTFKCRLGAMKVDGAGNLYRTSQTGSVTQYQVVAATNVPNLPNVLAASSTVGTNCLTATPTWNTTAVRGASGATLWAPPTATDVELVLSAGNVANNQSMAAPNTAYGGLSPNSTNPAPLVSYTPGATVAPPTTGWLKLEANTIADCTVTGAINFLAYKDNVNAN